jgi:hypothetical protein
VTPSGTPCAAARFFAATVCLLPADPGLCQDNRAAGTYTGTFEALYPEKVGDKTPTVPMKLQCAVPARCMLEFGGSKELFGLVRPAPKTILDQANGAVDYAREHKANAVAERPDLAPLLESTARIVDCIDLAKEEKSFAGKPEEPDGYIALCKLDRNPWRVPVVILMGTILANCGPAFCRYEILPLFGKP